MAGMASLGELRPILSTLGEKAGLCAGMVIVKMNGEAKTSVDAAVKEVSSSTDIVLNVSRVPRLDPPPSSLKQAKFFVVVEEIERFEFTLTKQQLKQSVGAALLLPALNLYHERQPTAERQPLAAYVARMRSCRPRATRARARQRVRGGGSGAASERATHRWSGFHRQ